MKAVGTMLMSTKPREANQLILMPYDTKNTNKVIVPKKPEADEADVKYNVLPRRGAQAERCIRRA